jgi:hypothetical protein
MVRRGWRDWLYFNNVLAEAKAAHSFYLGKAVPSGQSKTSEQAQSDPERYPGNPWGPEKTLFLTGELLNICE